MRLDGISSRTRVSPGGSYAAATTFVAGHSYLDKGFSTFTALIDIDKGEVPRGSREVRGHARRKALRRDRLQLLGRHVHPRRAALLRHPLDGRKFYLVEGDVQTRRARVVADGVERPSLSPDETRVAFKRRRGDKWRLHVLDLATGEETPLAEERSVDDQVEWLDDDRILYGLTQDVWVVQADGRGTPRIYLRDALSPAVVRS